MDTESGMPIKPGSKQLYGFGKNGGEASITIGGRGNKAWITENGVTKPVDLKEAARHVATANVPMSERPAARPVPARYTTDAKSSAVRDAAIQQKAAPKGEMLGGIPLLKANGFYKFDLPDGYKLYQFKVAAESIGDPLPEFDLGMLTNIPGERNIAPAGKNVFSHPLRFGEGFTFRTKDGHKIDLSQCKVTEFVSEKTVKDPDGKDSKEYRTKQTLIVDDRTKTVYMVPGSVAYQRPQILG